MTVENTLIVPQRFVPRTGQVATPNPIAYKATRLMAGALNVAQMALAEAYINGLEIPDPLFRSMMDRSMSILFQHAPGLLAPYEWVLQESDQLAESDRKSTRLNSSHRNTSRMPSSA